MYVFLDVDGVLNRESEWSKPYQLNQQCIDNFCQFLYMLKNTYSCITIVLTSTWRAGFDVKNGHLEHIEKLIGEISNRINVIFDKTAKSQDDDRMKEIKYFLARHDSQSYIIIDDDESLFSDNDNVFYVNSDTGFSKTDVKRGKKYVNNIQVTK